MIRPLLLLTASLASLSLMAAELPDKDRIFQKSGPVIEATEVVSETSETVTYKITANAQPGTKRSTSILRVDYAGMHNGAYAAGEVAMDRGAYDEAADRFHQAAQGEHEWEKVYGSLSEGEALELGKHYAEAAKAFQGVVAGFPKHRLFLDAMYRLGMNQAWAKDAGATKTADDLSSLAKGTIGQPAESRANAIRAAIAFAGGNQQKFDEYAKKTVLRASDEPDTWFHFTLWQADTYRLTGKAKDAARTIDGMLPQLDADPARKAQALGIKGLALIESDPQGALVELIKLDVLPFGSEEQRCEARFQAGKLMLNEAKTLAASPDTAKDERKTAFVAELKATARMLLQASADSLTSSPAKSEAQTLLQTLPAN
jgi:tetratricopeptide (TPR) repeat protein